MVQVFGILERYVLGRIDLGGCGRDLAEGRRAAGLGMGDDTVGRAAFLGRYLPRVGGGPDQHHARRGTALAHQFLGGADALAAGGEVIAPDALARHVLPGSGKFGRDLRPVAAELFGGELGKAGERALSHFGFGNADDDAVVRIDHDPGVDFGRRVGGLGRRQVEAERKSGARRGGADDEGTAVDFGHICHGCVPPHALPAAAWIAARMR